MPAANDNTNDSLQAAIDNAASGSTITLDRDVTESIVIDDNKTITIDLNGKKLTNTASQHTITVNLGASLTIIDSVGGGVVDNVSHGKGAIFNNGTVVLNGGTYTRSQEAGKDANNPNGNSWYTICNHGDMTINAGVTVSNNGHFSSMIENGYYSYASGNAASGYVSGVNSANPSLTINGGSFTGGINTIKNDDGGILTINDGNFANTTQATVLNWNVGTINGGTFDCSYSSCVLNGASSGSQSANNQGRLTINGGEFKSTGSNVANKFNDIEPTIAGGIYSQAPDKFVVENSTVIEANGKYAIGSMDNFNSISDIITQALSSGSPITILDKGPLIGITLPAGVTVVNKSGESIIVNGVELKGNETVVTTEPQTGSAAEAPYFVDYRVLEGKDGQWSKGSHQGLSFKLNSGNLLKVLIDGVEVEFEVSEDGLVTIAAQVLEALDAGVHTITFVYADGGISTNFVVNA